MLPLLQKSSATSHNDMTHSSVQHMMMIHYVLFSLTDIKICLLSKVQLTSSQIIK